ncbi:uroporphyrinogen III synthase HEM4, putative [Babesia ovis]|uniref:Uroporphyrinogen III synthase HEM4, putative n=1 Tax=Babesia ovis TaxID=5869 RepID=A0A9W5TA09_BABOV|nr:uroporphyrinogen III synthase HEM4, putative [Babesia ovis]
MTDFLSLSSGGEVGRSVTIELDKFHTRADGALGNLVEFSLGDISPLDEQLDGDSVDGDVVYQRDHAVTVATDAAPMYVPRVDLKLVGNVVAHPGGIQKSSHTNDLVLRESC